MVSHLTFSDREEHSFLGQQTRQLRFLLRPLLPWMGVMRQLMNFGPDENGYKSGGASESGSVDGSVSCLVCVVVDECIWVPGVPGLLL